MAQYKIKDPAGQMHVIEGPDNATPDEIMAQAPKLIPTDKGGYWSDVGKNALGEVKGMVESAPALAQGALNVADTPRALVSYLTERARGVPHEQTALAQDLGTIEGAVKSGPGVVKSMAKDMMNDIVDFEGSFRKRPLGVVGDLSILAGGVGTLAEKAAPSVAAALETSANAMGRRASGFTKALIKGKNFDRANDAVQWMMDKKIMTPGADAETMLERVGAAKDEAWTAMKQSMEEQNAGAKGALKPKAAPQLREQFLFDPKKAIDDLEGLRPRSKNGTVLTGGEYDAQNGAIDNAVATIKGHGNRPIPWDEANDLKGNLKANFDTTKSPSLNDLKKRIHGTFNDNMENQMDAAATARGGDISAFKVAKSDYGAAKTAEKALDNLRSSKAGNRTIGLTDFIAGTGGAAAHGGLGAVATVLAKKVIEKYGLTTGATIAQKLSVIASKAPKLLGPYAPIIQKALAVGGSELAFTHGILAKSDPNYRALMSGLTSE